MKIAILGGSFNPVHLGHVALAQSVVDQLSYDKILLIPALMSPLKQGHNYVSAEHRVRMLELAFREKSWAEVSSCEVNRKGPSYTYKTIEYLYDQYDFQGKPGLIVGDDWVEGFSRWKNVEDIVARTDLIVARREGGQERFPYPCSFLKNPVVTVSSTEIREEVQSGKRVDHLVPGPVAEYIGRHGLYQS
ncbi:MAG: nicotinate (nicotinamide) nucleotide adenylyltransferase [Spirochaetales bacterium]|nr:nicotinate (nicotinamide) nucleotide adenylyltransferase [Spirochaetales bacterium]